MKQLFFTLTIMIMIFFAANAKDFPAKHTECKSISKYSDTSMTYSINREVYNLCMGATVSKDVLNACREASKRADSTMTYILVADSFHTCINSGKDAVTITKCSKISRVRDTTMTEGFDASLLKECLTY